MPIRDAEEWPRNTTTKALRPSLLSTLTARPSAIPFGPHALSTTQSQFLLGWRKPGFHGALPS